MLEKKRLFFLCTSAAILVTSVVTAQSAVAPQGSVDMSTLDLGKVFQGSPAIYTTLIILSVLSFIIWLYSLLTLRASDMVPEEFLRQVREEIMDQRFEAALATCREDNNYSASIIACGLAARKHGPQLVMDAMQAEGRRTAAALWQRISLLNDVVVIAPMLGLLGTVLGMFFAFYDTNRTAETITSIFDGLGIAVGTTVAGLIVAIISMIFYTTLKFRVTRLISAVENEVLSIGNIMEWEAKQTEKNS
jgi:biopolymer transport protein ExbB